MERITEIDNEFASLWYYPEEKIVHHKFHKFIYGDAFRQIIMRGVQLFEEHGCVKWLSDDRENPVLNATDKAWGDVHWSPRVLAAGWKYWALVMPTKAIGQHSMQRLVDQYKELGVEVHVCDDPDEGLAWLMRQGKEEPE